MNHVQWIEQELRDSAWVKLELGRVASKPILQMAQVMAKALKADKKVVIFGNGGSAGDAQHIAGELVGRFVKERRALPAIALTTDSSIMTAVANDYSYEEIFSRQVEGLVRKGDVAIGISTSGRSPNVIRAILAAKKMGAVTVGLTGQDGEKLARVADVAVKVPSRNTQRIQESHITIAHLVCGIVEDMLFPVRRPK